MYDVTNHESFEKIRTWAAQIEEYGDKNLCKLLVGNKTDKEAERTVSKQEGQSLAKSLGIDFLETSAKDTSNVEAAFTKLATSILHSFQFVACFFTRDVFPSFFCLFVCLCCRSGSMSVPSGGNGTVNVSGGSASSKKSCCH